MNKMPLILDVDDSIINSTQSFAECYNLLYKNHTDFAEADWTKCNKYDLSDIIGSSKRIQTAIDMTIKIARTDLSVLRRRPQTKCACRASV